MKFGIPNETYHCVVYDDSGNQITNEYFNGVRVTKKLLLEWAKNVAAYYKKKLNHISVCRESTSEIMRYTPSGAISCLSK